MIDEKVAKLKTGALFEQGSLLENVDKEPLVCRVKSATGKAMIFEVFWHDVFVAEISIDRKTGDQTLIQ